MTRNVTVALTETKNAYAPMPESIADLPALEGKLDDVRDANVQHHLALLAKAAASGVHVVCLGELFAAPYFALRQDKMWLSLAEDALTGPTITVLREAARRHSMIIVAPIYELDPDTNRRFNTAVVIDEGGEVLGKYRKTHIPAGTNEQGEFHETFYYGPSDGNLGEWPANRSSNPYFPVFETSRCRLGVAICYDRHFWGVTQQLAHNGAELVLSPAVTFGDKSRRMWDLEFAVDAARHNLFIGGSNRKGAEPPWNQRYFGESYFAGPNGRIHARANGDGLVIADLDLDVLAEPDPSGWDLARDLRADIYRS
jgi:N-carbamoylputrescine amidase